MAEILASEIAFVAEDDDGAPVGFALARRRSPALGTLTDLYVTQDARRSGIGTELMREVLAAFGALGIEHDRSRRRGIERSRALPVRRGGASATTSWSWPARSRTLEARLGGQEAARSARSTSSPTISAPSSRRYVSSSRGSRRLARLARRSPAKRLDRRVRRCLRPQSRDAAPARARALAIGWGPSRCSSASSGTSSCE